MSTDRCAITWATSRGVGLAITDAVALPDGRTLVSAAADNTPNAVDDGPVVGVAVALLEDDRTLALAAIPPTGQGVLKVEGLAVLEHLNDGLRLLAVTDVDEPGTASLELRLRLWW